MNRAQFMERLKVLLSDISETEREEALEYYENYFEDAGAENEANVIKDLGSPENVAATIKANMSESDKAFGEFTDRGYEDFRTGEEKQVPEVSANTFRDRVKRNPNSVLILVIIALVFLSPILGIAKGVVKAVIGLIIALLVLPFTLVIAFGGTGIGLISGGVAMALRGFWGVLTLSGGILEAGAGCIMTAAGIFLILLAVRIGKRMIPKYLQIVTSFGQSLLRRFRKEGDDR